MGIKGLANLLAERAPGSITDQSLENYFGRVVAIDASMSIYQFMVVVGRTGDQLLTNEAGEVTSHLQGLFNRTIRLLDAGIKPVYVFDGKPPEAKKEELKRRFEGRDKANTALVEAQEKGDQDEIEKYSKRTVKVTKMHNEECKKLLQLMGIPIHEAPSEAEAECAALCSAGKVYSAATEDMDALTFGSTKLSRHLVTPGAGNKQAMIKEYSLQRILEELKFSMDQFIDFCILCGCDYCERIPGIGPQTAFNLITKHGSIEAALQTLDKNKVPENWGYQLARKLFQEADVTAEENMPIFKWGPVDEEGLKQFLVQEKNFNEERVAAGIKKMKISKGKSSQNRLEAFFGAAQRKVSNANKNPSTGKPAAASKKRKI